MISFLDNCKFFSLKYIVPKMNGFGEFSCLIECTVET